MFEISEQDMDAMVRNYQNKKRREDYHKHPERNFEQRKRSYTNFLNKCGYSVINVDGIKVDQLLTVIDESNIPVESMLTIKSILNALGGVSR